MKDQIRVRFAPSPTGPLHIGGVRTALFNYFFAKRNKGKFILRIEDTDETRYVEGAEKYIMESLKWCGIKFDEGIIEGGEYGPYRQSERKNIYTKYAQELIDSGNAYYAFDTPEELEQIRKDYEAEKKTFAYGNQNRENLNNSLLLDKSEVEDRIRSGVPYVLRFKMPVDKEVVFKDIIRGEIKVNTNTLDDKVLYKSSGMPTYHMANIVDDHLMEISHVIRGEEWLPSLPLHVLLYEAFNWTKPEFAHLPLLLKPSGKGKLSKRDGEKMGFPVFPLLWCAPNGEESRGYKEDGYFPEAFVNMLSLMGWNAGTEQEIFSMEELINDFTLERVGKAGAKFDPDKAKWFNNQYLQKKSNLEIAEQFSHFLNEKQIKIELNKLEQIVSLVKDRVSFVPELFEHTTFFFNAPEEYDNKVIKKKWKEDTPGILKGLIELLSKMELSNRNALEEEIKLYVENNELGFGQVMNPLRLCLVGSGSGPDLLEIVLILGKEETIARIQKAIEII